MPDVEVTRFTDSFSEAVAKLYRVGGFALAFGFSGIIVMLGARMFAQEYTLWLMLLGAALTFSCLAFFLYTTVRGNNEVKKSVANNKEAIDAVQDISIQLTRLTSAIQAYSFKNINQLNQVLGVAIPKLKAVPFLGEKLTDYGLDDAHGISAAIVEKSDSIEKLIHEIENALVNADHKKLKEFSGELATCVAGIKDQLKK